MNVALYLSKAKVSSEKFSNMNPNEQWWFFYPSNIQKYILHLAKLTSFKFVFP